MGPTYYNTFIEVAEDCPVTSSEVPQAKGDIKTKAVLEYELIARHPYEYTGEDIAFLVHAMYNEIPNENWKEERVRFFSKGQPCLRASALGKRYGWGTHHDENGKIALVPMESKAYKKFISTSTIKRLKAMSTRKA